MCERSGESLLWQRVGGVVDGVEEALLEFEEVEVGEGAAGGEVEG